MKSLQNEKPGVRAGYFAPKLWFRRQSSGVSFRVSFAASLMLTFTLKFGISGYFSSNLFSLTCRLFEAALNTIFVHRVLFFLVVVGTLRSANKHSTQGDLRCSALLWIT